jgi:UDP:flavonoid glycosyltransferase YjiC (YdhE family)
LPAPEGRPLRLLLGAFGDPGHAFPIIALGGTLAARGHAVVLQTWSRWEDDVRAAGMEFAAAPEYHVFPTRERPLKPYEAVVRATGETRPLVESLRPDVVVADILTLAPALAAELSGVPVATVIPHVDPRSDRGWPPYSLGARLPRTTVGRRLWEAAARATDAGLERGRLELNETRRRLGLGPLEHVHGGISRALALVATFPQLEYPRAVALPATHVVGPLLWEPPFGEVELPPGEDPLVLVAPSTSQDPSHRLLRAALAGLADAPVRVLASTNRRPLGSAAEVPPNARLVDWV